jgi:hypothetical protein
MPRALFFQLQWSCHTVLVTVLLCNLLVVCCWCYLLVCCRFQKLRKKIGLTVTDTVELYYQPLPAAAAADGSLVARIADGHADYLKEALGVVLQPLEHKPEGSTVIASEEQSVGNEELGSGFNAVLAAPAGSSLAAAGLRTLALG